MSGLGEPGTCCPKRRPGRWLRCRGRAAEEIANRRPRPARLKKQFPRCMPLFRAIVMNRHASPPPPPASRRQFAAWLRTHPKQRPQLCLLLRPALAHWHVLLPLLICILLHQHQPLPLCVLLLIELCAPVTLESWRAAVGTRLRHAGWARANGTSSRRCAITRIPLRAAVCRCVCCWFR